MEKASTNKKLEPDKVGSPVIPALGRQRQEISEFEASLVYRVSSRTARAIQRNPVEKKQTNKQKTLGYISRHSTKTLRDLAKSKKPLGFQSFVPLCEWGRTMARV